MLMSHSARVFRWQGVEYWRGQGVAIEAIRRTNRQVGLAWDVVAVRVRNARAWLTSHCSITGIQSWRDA